MAARVAAARTTTKNHGSAPRAEGARVAAARIRRMAASDTGAGRKRRSARCVSTTVKKSSGAPTLHRPGAGRDEEPGDEDEADAHAGYAYGRSTKLGKPRRRAARRSRLSPACRTAEAFAQRAGLARGVSVSPGRLRPTVFSHARQRA